MLSAPSTLLWASLTSCKPSVDFVALYDKVTVSNLTCKTSQVHLYTVYEHTTTHNSGDPACLTV
ncbi:MAG: hypothetical protein PHQ33_07360 [Bacteroidales bacterium]|nr:hypothetical protein [Bacteroidales bacterium]